MFSGQNTHAKHSYASKRQIPSYIQQITPNPFKRRLKTITLTSRTWKRLKAGASPTAEREAPTAD